MYSYWLHMNEQYLWRWYCSDERGIPVAMSSSVYFDRSAAERAMHKLRQDKTAVIL